MKGNSKTLIISLVLTGFAILLVVTYINQREAAIASDLGTPVEILIANRDIPENTPIEESYVSIMTMPKKFVKQSPNFLSKPKDVVGTVAAIPISKEEVITTNKLLFMGDKTGLAPLVSKGKRAIAIRASSLTSVSSLIKPGDRIDIIAAQTTTENNEVIKKVKTILQDVFVLSIGNSIYTQVPYFEQEGPRDLAPCVQKTQRVTPEGFADFTIEVTPKQAQSIVAVSDSDLYYSLRSQDDRTNEVLTSTTRKQVFGVSD
jgi:pilus assembly protein CpaB